MTSIEIKCGTCNKSLPKNLRVISCDTCKNFYHVKCCGTTHKEFNSVKSLNLQWYFNKCNPNLNVPQCENGNSIPISQADLNMNDHNSRTSNKCGNCKKHMPEHLRIINCDSCKTFYHVKCCRINHKQYNDIKNRNELWHCVKCVQSALPFSKLDKNDECFEMNSIFVPSSDSEECLGMPSFTIQSLLDKMPGQNFETDEFLSETITSKYFTPSEFLENKLSPSHFSMIHINIASLTKHINQLRCLLTILNHPFDVIGITETRLHQDIPLVNLDIDGYDFTHTPTNTQCGGAGMYVKSKHNFEIKDNFSKAIDDIVESLFIEIKRDGQKNLIIGCIYRHHSTIPSFITEYLDDALKLISKQSSKICALMGDFNVDLIKYSTDTNTSKFYDLLCSHNFRPLILQPSRVTSKTATLIDNIFINDISCNSFGGNITSSISDHFFQFCQTDMFGSFKHNQRIKYSRDFRNFNKREFCEELGTVNWQEILNESDGTEISYNKFYGKLDDILNHMAPYKKLTQKEIRLAQMPWITQGLLVSMRVRDKLYKQTKDNSVTNDIIVLYKRYRNMIVNLLRISRNKYHTSFFQENQGNVKKTWDGIRSLINISKKKCATPSKVFYKNQEMSSDNEIANSFNHFFTNIGSSIEAKIPKSKESFFFIFR